MTRNSNSFSWSPNAYTWDTKSRPNVSKSWEKHLSLIDGITPFKLSNSLAQNSITILLNLIYIALRYHRKLQKCGKCHPFNHLSMNHNGSQCDYRNDLEWSQWSWQTATTDLAKCYYWLVGLVPCWHVGHGNNMWHNRSFGRNLS